MRYWLMFSLGLFGCTMDNPAFGMTDTDGASGGGSEDGGDGADGVSADGGPGSADGGSADGSGDDTGDSGGDDGTHGGDTVGDDGPGDDGPGDDGGSTGAADDTTGGDLCDYGRSPPLDIRLQSQNPGHTCENGVASYFKVLDVVPNGYQIERCYGDGCSNCSVDEIFDFTLWPLKPEDVAVPTCMWADFEALYNQNDGCRYQGVSIWRETEQTETPWLVGSQNYGTPGAVYAAINQFQPALELDYSCDCSEVEDVPMCCESEPPSAYKMNVNGSYVYPGDWTSVSLGEDPRVFQFHNVQSYHQGICGANLLSSWALIRP